MSITIAPGRGILGGVVLDDERADRERAEERKREQEYAEREAAHAAKIEKIGAHLASLLRDQIEAESAQPVITSEIKQSFARFQAQCESNGLCSLPASPEAVAEHLIVESNAARPKGLPQGAQRAEQLRDSISAIHRAMNLPDPTADLLVRATMRWFRENDEPVSKRPARSRKANGASKMESGK